MLDASAVIAWALGERGADVIGRLLQFSVIPAPNLTEALYRARARGHRMTSDQLRAHILALGAIVEPFTDDDTVLAAELLTYVATNPGPDRETLSLGDVQCIAIAERLSLPVAGDDQLWSILPLTVKFHRFR